MHTGSGSCGVRGWPTMRNQTRPVAKVAGSKYRLEEKRKTDPRESSS